MATQQAAKQRTYGNISSLEVPGVLGLGLLGTTVAGIGAGLTMILLWIGSSVVLALVVAVLTLPAVWIVQSKDGRGRSRMEKMLGKRRNKIGRKKGHHRYVAGPASQLPRGRYPAPGLLADTELIDAQTSFGQPFVMLWNASTETGSVFMGTSSAGVGLRDQGDVDLLVDAWSAFQRDAGSVAGLVQVSVTTQTTADPGERLRDAVDVAQQEAGAGERQGGFSAGVMDEVVNDLSQWTPRVEQWIALTFSAREHSDGSVPKRSPAELAQEIGSLIPGFSDLAGRSGGGAVQMLTAVDIVDSTHVAYNPTAAAAVERARLSREGTGLTWDEVGPTFAEKRSSPLAHWAHEGAVSKSWQMFRPPSGTFRETGLAPLLSPDGKFMQKRVTVFYRPSDPETSQREVNSNITNAEFAMNQRNHKPSAGERLAVRKANQAAEEQAIGAAMVRFSLMVTVTVESAEELPRAEAAIRQRSSQGIQLRIRDCLENDDAGFAMNLGLGIVPSWVATLPDSVRRSL